MPSDKSIAVALEKQIAANIRMVYPPGFLDDLQFGIVAT